MKKYITFDIEIAFDFGRIPTDLFPPDDGEMVLLAYEGNEIEAKYIGNIIKRFRLPSGKLVKSEYWKYQGGDWRRFRPLGITCAAAMSSDGELWNWHANEKGLFCERMDMASLQDLVIQLMKLSRESTIMTWNGLGFDFDILAEVGPEPHRYDVSLFMQQRVRNRSRCCRQGDGATRKAGGDDRSRRASVMGRGGIS
jgi:hypothetical protein